METMKGISVHDRNMAIIHSDGTTCVAHDAILFSMYTVEYCIQAVWMQCCVIDEDTSAIQCIALLSGYKAESYIQGTRLSYTDTIM